MTWVKGKSYWDELRTKGWKKPKAIESPEKMWELFLEYAADVDSNPAEKVEQVKTKIPAPSVMEAIERGEMPILSEDPRLIKINVQRPYHWTGFEAFLSLKGIITSTLKEYKQNRKGNYSEYSQVIASIDQIMYSQKFEGATMGYFNANIIARDLGLADKREVAAKVEDDLDYSQLSEAALEEIAKVKAEAQDSDWNAGLSKKS